MDDRHKRRHPWIKAPGNFRRVRRRCGIGGTVIDTANGSVSPDGDVKCMELATQSGRTS